MDEQTGLIAILDALGAATYNREEIDRFLNSRELREKKKWCPRRDSNARPSA
jgi:hypothetical protein